MLWTIVLIVMALWLIALIAKLGGGFIYLSLAISLMFLVIQCALNWRRFS